MFGGLHSVHPCNTSRFLSHVCLNSAGCICFPKPVVRQPIARDGTWVCVIPSPIIRWGLTSLIMQQGAFLLLPKSLSPASNTQPDLMHFSPNFESSLELIGSGLCKSDLLLLQQPAR